MRFIILKIMNLHVGIRNRNFRTKRETELLRQNWRRVLWPIFFNGDGNRERYVEIGGSAKHDDGQ